MTLDDSPAFTSQAESHLQRLTVDDRSFTQVISMGFTGSEARLALRACHGNVTQAVDYISRRKQEKLLRRDKEKREKKQRKEAKQYGTTATGKLIELQLLTHLKDMGFEHGMAVEALRQCDNNIEQALETLQNKPELLVGKYKPPIRRETIDQFVAMGFGEKVVKEILRECNSDPNKTLERLISLQASGGLASFASSQQGSSTSEGVDVDAGADADVDMKDDSQEDKLDEQIAETFADIQQGDDDDDDAYLDLTLTEETELMNKYKMLLAKAMH